MSAFAFLERQRIATVGGSAILQRKCAACGSGKVGPTYGSCNPEACSLQRHSPSAGALQGHEAPPIVHQVLGSSGQGLGQSDRAFFEPRFGHDFSGVRVHSRTEHRSRGATDAFGRQRESAALSTDPPRATETPKGSLVPKPGQQCAHPTNFKLAPATDSGTHDIHINITWESSTGYLTDLLRCKTREVVTYDPIPNPPFLEQPVNPTEKERDAFLGEGGDTHRYTLGLRDGITRPRTAGTMVSHQVFQYRCTGEGCTNVWNDFPNQHYTITREVFPQYFRPNPWRYRVSKVGVDNDYHYAREVEVPE
jgi:hypothetical protein